MKTYQKRIGKLLAIIGFSIALPLSAQQAAQPANANPSPRPAAAPAAAASPAPANPAAARTIPTPAPVVSVPVATTEGERCLSIYLRVRNEIRRNPDRKLEIVAKYVNAFFSCSCEIVKAAIEESKADVTVVAAIVEAALIAAPVENYQMIVQCAIAAAPDAVAGIRAVVARLAVANPALKNVVTSNPLDIPNTGLGGPTFTTPGGNPSLPVAPPVLVSPRPVTDVDF